MKRWLIALAVVTTAACANNPVPDQRLADQQARVDSARAVVERETRALGEMRDSLEARVAATVALDVNPEQARVLEDARIATQERLLLAAQTNLEAQQEYLALLKQAARVE